MQVGTARVLNAVTDAVCAGVRNFVIPGGGFTDSGDDAALLADGLRKLRSEAGIQVVGPNCMGVVDLVTGAAPYIGTVPAQIRRGTVGVVVQSGAVAELFVNAGGRVALSTVVSCGTEATTAMADYLGFFADDPETKSVIAFVEGFSEPHEFLAAARRLAEAGKPLAVAFVGRSATAQTGVTAHSGQLAPSARVTAAALRQAGAVIADDLDELLAFGEIFSCERLPRGNRLQVVTNSGGEGNLLADLAEDAGLVLPSLSAGAVDTLAARWPRFRARNPLDPWGPDDYESLRGLLGAVTPPAQTMEAVGLHLDLRCLSRQRNLRGCREASGSCADSAGRARIGPYGSSRLRERWNLSARRPPDD